MSEQPNTRPDDGVSYRFGTLLGATVDIRLHDRAAQATCTGCDDGHGNDALGRVRDWAQQHAAMCRALPKPEGTNR